MIWQLAGRSDPQVIELVDRHYHRRPGSMGKQVGPPGRVLILKTFGAEWITHWPFPEYCDHRWKGMWICASFRKETQCQHLASDLVRQAVAATRWANDTRYGWNWGRVEPMLMTEAGVLGSFVTFVDPTKVTRSNKYRKPPKDIGRCFLEAGFIPDGTTENGLLAFVLPSVSLPSPEPPHHTGYLRKIALEALRKS